MAKKELTQRQRDRIRELLGAGVKDDVELRTRTVELRINRKEDGALPKIEGYAAVFNKDSDDMGFIERVAPGAFKNALKISDARALFNHDPNYVLGRQSSGTLELKEDKAGLFMSVQPPDTQLIRDMVLTPIERGDINQQSFGFIIKDAEWENLDTDHPVRTITEVREIFDVSPVTFPAYTDTTVALRSLALAKKDAGSDNDADNDASDDDDFSSVVAVFDFASYRNKALDDKMEEIRASTLGLRNGIVLKSEQNVEKFIQYMEIFRSLLSPMTADSDNASGGSDDHNQDDEPEDELLKRIRKLEARYRS